MKMNLKMIWKTIRRFYSVHFLALGMTISGCAAIDNLVTPVFMMSADQEVQLGQQLHQELQKQMEFVNDPAIVNYIRQVGNTVVANAPEAAVVPPQFFVVENKEINAFAIPGGGIYVHTGLIHASDDEAELASVLAHEYGHVLHRHSAQQVSRQTSYGLLSQLLLGENAGAIAQLATNIAATGAIAKYSREDELEADSVGIPTLYRAGYDPNAIITFFQTLEERYGSRGGGLATFLATHPPTGDRIAAVQARIAELPPKQGLGRPVDELRRVQSRLAQIGIAE